MLPLVAKLWTTHANSTIFREDKLGLRVIRQKDDESIDLVITRLLI